MSKRIGSGGISSMLELIRKLSPSFVGGGALENEPLRANLSRDVLAWLASFWKYLVRVSPPVCFLSRCLCATYTWSLVFFFFHWWPCTSVAREIQAIRRGFFFSIADTWLQCWYDIYAIRYVTLHYGVSHSRVKWFNFDIWMIVSIGMYDCYNC